MCFVAVLNLQFSAEVQVLNQLVMVDARDAHKRTEVLCERLRLH